MAVTLRRNKGSSLTYDEMDDNFDAIAPRTSNTGAVQVPAGTTSERTSSPIAGELRYNISLNVFEGYQNGAWQTFAAGSGGEVNQNAFSEFQVSGQSTISAASATDSVELIAGTGISITTDVAGTSITINGSQSNTDFGALTNTPTTLAGYGITDAFDGDYSSLANTPIIPANTSALVNDSGFITTYTETDPTVPAHVKNITTVQKNQWDTAYGWGNHADAGYAFAAPNETDPIFSASAAAGITTDNITDWNQAYAWGDHANAGYLTAVPSESNDLSSTVTWVTVPDQYISNTSVLQHLTDLSITESQISDLQNYLTANTVPQETDPVFIAHTAYNITDQQGFLYNDGSGNWSYGNPGGAGEVNDLSAVVTWDIVPDEYISETSVTQYEANLTITESQISDLGTYISSESDPVFLASPAGSITANNVLEWNEAYGWGDHANAGYISTELDPVFNAHTTSNISDGLGFLRNDGNGVWSYGSSSEVNDLSASVTWITVPDLYISLSSVQQHQANLTFSTNQISDFGNYLETESDPVFLASVAANITANNVSDWNTAYGWGDHSTAGYLTSFLEQDPIFSAHTTANISDGTGFLVNDGSGTWTYDNNTYLTSYTETDPIFSVSDAAGITSTDITNWNTAYGWGDHSTAGYLIGETSHADVLVDGDFATAGFMKTDGSGNYSVDNNTYLTGYTETDTLDSVTGRGDTTTNNITVGSIETSNTVSTSTLHRKMSDGIGWSEEHLVSGQDQTSDAGACVITVEFDKTGASAADDIIQIGIDFQITMTRSNAGQPVIIEGDYITGTATGFLNALNGDTGRLGEFSIVGVGLCTDVSVTNLGSGLYGITITIDYNADGRYKDFTARLNMVSATNAKSPAVTMTFT